MQDKGALYAESPFVLLFTQFFVSLAGGDDAVHSCTPEAVFFQNPDTGNGTAAGGTDRIFQCTGMLSGGENQFRRTGHGSGGIFICLCPGDAAGHSAVGQRFDEHVHQ